MYSINNNPIGVNYNLISTDFSSVNAKIDEVIFGTITQYENFDLSVSVHNSGYTNDYFVYVSCNTDENYKITGSTQSLRNSSFTWILRNKIIISGDTTINVKLYNGDTIIDEKNYNTYVEFNPLIISGGTMSTYDIYTLHTFTSTDYFYLSGSSTGLIADVLCVAGGGGGGADAGPASVGAGGGGAGGVLFIESYVIQNSSHLVSVGAGGAKATTAGFGTGSSGGNSVFSGITSYGGGKGASYNGDNAFGGGSGGGAVLGDVFGSGFTGQGFRGGGSGYHNGGSGGGGATEVGFDYGSGNSNAGGNGGSGLTCNITGTDIVYGGGGGGGTNAAIANIGGVGGLGGGGNGGGNYGNTPATSGTNGLGGGGGGAAGTGGMVDGADGGSGIVIIRYITP